MGVYLAKDPGRKWKTERIPKVLKHPPTCK